MRIKALEWKNNNDKTSTIVCYCHTAIGLYQINKIQDDKYCVIFHRTKPISGTLGSIDQCKEKTQGNFEEIVKECLEN